MNRMSENRIEYLIEQRVEERLSQLLGKNLDIILSANDNNAKLLEQAVSGICDQLKGVTDPNMRDFLMSLAVNLSDINTSITRLGQGLVEYYAPEGKKQEYKGIVDQNVAIRMDMANNIWTNMQQMVPETENSKKFL